MYLFLLDVILSMPNVGNEIFYVKLSSDLASFWDRLNRVLTISPLLLLRSLLGAIKQYILLSNSD